MSEGLLAASRALRAALADFDPDLLSGADCVAVAEDLATTEKACAAARARAGLRAADCGAHRALGFADAADWLARTSGSSAGAARTALDTAAAVERCPETRAALVAGGLSLAQADEIARTEKARPGAETELVAMARRSGLGALREEARRRRLEGADRDELSRRQRQARQLRHWTDSMGMVCLSAALPPGAGVPLVNRLEAETDRIRRAARAEGRDERREAHAADALVALVALAGAGGGGGGGRRRAYGADLVIVCDLRAWRRGHTHRGEPCHLVGGGPVPVSTARELGDDAFLKAVSHDGVRIDTVAHFGRHIRAELRTALELGTPPAFDGISCAEEGCDRRYGLEWDHVDPVANQGVTSYENLRPRCWPHHRAKTERDRLAGLLRRRPGAEEPP